MPRGIKRTPQSINDQIDEIQQKIVTYESKIMTLNKQKKTLLASKEKNEIDELYQFIKKTGKTPSEILSELTH